MNIPVKLFPAVKTKQVRFHLLHAKDGVRLQQKLICPLDHLEAMQRAKKVGIASFVMRNNWKTNFRTR